MRIGKKARTRIRIKKATRIVAIVLFIVLFFILLINTHALTINKINISTDKAEYDITKIAENINDKLLKSNFFITGRNTYLFNNEKLKEEILSESSSVDDVEINWSFLNVLSVKLKIRDLFGTYCNEEKCFLIDDKGIIYATGEFKVGYEIQLAEDIDIENYQFYQVSDEENFRYLIRVIDFLKVKNYFDEPVVVESITLSKTASIVILKIEGIPPIWIDTKNSIFETTRDIHINFSEIFTKKELQKFKFINLEQPGDIIYLESSRDTQ